MIKFTVKNFQSIEEATFEFDKFVTFVGPSNRGKTAVVRALRTLLYNVWDKSFLRKGAKECVLELELSGDSPIQKVKLTKPKNEYILTFQDGKTKKFPKSGKDTPEELKDLRFALIESERGGKFNLNFQTQLEPLFLIGESEVLVTSFFNSVFKIVRYEGALRNINKDITKVNKDYEANNKTLTEKELELEQVDGEKFILENKILNIDSCLILVGKLESEYERVIQGIEDLQKVGKLKDELIVLRKDDAVLQTSIEGVNQLGKVLNDLEILGKYQIEGEEAYQKGVVYEDQRDKLSSKLNVLDSFRDIIKHFYDVQFATKVWQESVTYIENAGLQVGKDQAQIDFYGKTTGVLDKLREVNYAIEAITYEERGLGDLIDSCNGLYKSKVEIEKYTNFVKNTIGVCPLCDNQLD